MLCVCIKCFRIVWKTILDDQRGKITSRCISYSFNWKQMNTSHLLDLSLVLEAHTSYQTLIIPVCPFLEVLWYIGLNPWLWIKGMQVWFPSMPGTIVLRQDTLSTLLLSTQVYTCKWVGGEGYVVYVFACNAMIGSLIGKKCSLGSGNCAL